MASEETRVEVEICGEYYILKGKESPEYMQMVAQYVNRKIKQVSSRNPRLSAAKAAVLAAINIADELSKLQEDYDDLVKMMDKEVLDCDKDE
ncbi:cell division protein ZapA [Desulfohalotomaculum tongense]|uniref:cell division protein ZapA n=1 Tax=Desulforadius tongensis TaxID=1216062 RepID=UPI00195EF1B5|nr:cell division protein ZapA [Desulforadius tongensis]MBM7854784.1 cell division protein ZapA [Desulforadius tongensis]